MVCSHPRKYVTSRNTPIRFTLLGMLLLLSLMFTACGGATSATTGSSSQKATVPAPKSILIQGVLTIGTNADYPPMESLDPTTNQLTGFDMDLITALAQRIGLQPRIMNTGFDTLIPSLQAKRYDVVMATAAITANRQKRVDLLPYFNAGKAILVQKGNPAHVKSLVDLCGKTVVVENGTIEQIDLQNAVNTCKQAKKPAINTTILQSQNDVVQALATGRVVAAYQDEIVTDYYLKQNAGRFDIGGLVGPSSAEGIAVYKGNTDLENALKAALAQVKQGGTYDKLRQKWGLVSQLH